MWVGEEPLGYPSLELPFMCEHQVFLCYFYINCIFQGKLRAVEYFILFENQELFTILEIHITVGNTIVGFKLSTQQSVLKCHLHSACRYRCLSIDMILL